MKVFTVGQVARVCKVSRQRVSRWVDSGRLKANCGFISREYLVKFLNECGVFLADFEDEDKAKVLIIAQDTALMKDIRESMPSKAFKFRVADSNFEAGIQVADFHPDCIVVDFSLGYPESRILCQSIWENSCFKDSILIALVPFGSGLGKTFPLINAVFNKPIDSALLARRIWSLVSAKKELSSAS